MLRINKNTIVNNEEDSLENLNDSIQSKFGDNIAKNVMNNIAQTVNEINKKKSKGSVNYIVVSEEIAKTLNEFRKSEFVYLNK